MIFRRFRAEYTDGVIDLVPLHIDPPNPELRFGHEQIWRITQHNSRREIGQISYRDGESRGIYYYGHIGYHIEPPYRGNRGQILSGKKAANYPGRKEEKRKTFYIFFLGSGTLTTRC